VTTRDVGDRVNLRYEARDPDGDLVAATVVLTVTDPSGNTDTPALTNDATGIYDGAFTLDEAGLWTWEWAASGAVVDKQFGAVYAAARAPGTYATLAQLRKRVLSGAASASQTGDRDEELQGRLLAAARGFDEDCGRRPGGFELDAVASARHYSVARHVVYDRGSGRHKLLIDELGSQDDLEVAVGGDSSWTVVTDYRTEPRNALADLRPVSALSRLGGWGCDEVRVTARWGWPVVRDDVVEAVLIAAHRLYWRRDSPDGTKGAGELGIVRIARSDPDYERIVARYALPGIA
jgi:hypothetical protein